MDRAPALAGLPALRLPERAGAASRERTSPSRPVHRDEVRTAAIRDPALARLKTRVTATLQLVREQHPEDGPWSDPEGMCLDLAAKWYPFLREAGLPAAITVVDPALRPSGQAVPPGMAGKFHAFLTLDAGKGKTLIVDASWRQFVAGAAGRRDLPDIFVGTSDELRQALGRERPFLRIEIVDDPLQGRRDPDELVDLAYGEGPHAVLRQILPETDQVSP